MNNIIIKLLMGTALAASFQLRAQTIGMKFPAFAGKTYDLILFQGDKQVTALQGTIPSDGNFTMVIPKAYAPYTGMGRWLITGTREGGGLDMPIPGKDFSVSCLTDKPSREEDFTYKNNADATVLNTMFREQQSILMKANAMTAALQSFSTSDAAYPTFEREYAAQQRAYESFEKGVANNPCYAAKVFNIFGITRGLGTRLYEKEQAKAANIADYIAHDMNMDVLFTSGHWTSIISAWVDIHTQVLKDKQAFATDLASIERKCTDKQFTDFAGRVAYYLTQQGKDDFMAAAAPVVNASKKILAYEGSMQGYKKALVDSKAPDLIIREHIGNMADHNHKDIILKSNKLVARPQEKTLLIFYESGCGPCENLMQQLPGNYEAIRKKGVRVISISSDTDEALFRSKSRDLPWKDAYCDYEGNAGINFRNYGVSATPTIFLIDHSGNVEAKMASLQDVLDHLK